MNPRIAACVPGGGALRSRRSASTLHLLPDGLTSGPAEIDHSSRARHPRQRDREPGPWRRRCVDKRDCVDRASAGVESRSLRCCRTIQRAIAQISSMLGSESHPDRTLAVARSIYLWTPQGAKLSGARQGVRGAKPGSCKGCFQHSCSIALEIPPAALARRRIEY